MFFSILKKIAFKEELKQNALLRKKIERLQDENESLWQMIDEIRASDIKNHNMTKEIDMIVEKTKDRISRTIGVAKIVSKSIKKETE